MGIKPVLNLYYFFLIGFKTLLRVNFMYKIYGYNYYLSIELFILVYHLFWLDLPLGPIKKNDI